MKRITSGLAAAACAVVPLLTVVAPAEASSRWQMRASGSFATVDWVEMGELGGDVLGNVHLGNLFVEGDKRITAFGTISDWTCEEGQMPTGGGHGEEPPEDSGCTLEAERFIFGEGLTLTMDRKLGSARLTGTMQVQNHDGEGPVGSPSVDITWTGTGVSSTSTYSDSYTDSTGVKFSTKRTETSREATVSGRIGAMGFADDADDVAVGRFGTFRTMERSFQP